MKSYHRECAIADVVADSAAAEINGLAERLYRDGKCHVLVVQPTEPEIYGEDPDEQVSPGATVADIRYPSDRLVAGVKVPVIDPTANLRAPLYYAVDMQYTPRGYGVVGETVGRYLKESAPTGCAGAGN